MFRGARLGGFPTLEQLHSSVVIAKDTSSVTLFDSILPGALESASAGEPLHQHLEGGPEEDGCGGQAVQEVVEPFQVVHFLVDNDVCFLSSFPRAGNTHTFLYQLLPS